MHYIDPFNPTPPCHMPKTHSSNNLSTNTTISTNTTTPSTTTIKQKCVKKNKKLFVCGYMCIEKNIYKNLSYLHDTEFFYFTMKDSIQDIILRLYNQIEQNDYDTIIGHSIGCLFVIKYLERLLINKKTIKKRIILSHPLIDKDDLPMYKKVVGLLPTFILQYVYIPTYIHTFPFDLTYNYSTLDTSLLNYYVYNLRFFGDILKLINKNKFIKILTNFKKQITIIYGEDDTFAPISNDSKVIYKKSVNQFITFKSKHEPFNDNYIVSESYKKILLKLLKI
jgi:hypothetical protein